MKRIVKTIVLALVLVFACAILTACATVNEKKFAKAFDKERYENVEIIMETYTGTTLRKTVYLIQNDLIKCDVYNYDNETLTDTVHQYYKDLGDGSSDAYLYVSTTSVWTKLDEKSDVTIDYILKYLTDFADSDINSYTYNKEFKEYVKKTDDGLVELVFDNGKLHYAMNGYKEKVSGTRITFDYYGLVRNLQLPDVAE